MLRHCSQSIFSYGGLYVHADFMHSIQVAFPHLMNEAQPCKTTLRDITQKGVVNTKGCTPQASNALHDNRHDLLSHRVQRQQQKS